MQKVKFTFFIVLSINYLAFGQRQNNPLKIKNPLGTTYLYDSLFIDITEVANIHYLEYLHFVLQDSTEEFYLSQLPISIYSRYNFRPKDSLDSVNHLYLYNRATRFYPVLGASNEQAKSYCSWRSALVNNRMQTKALWRDYLKNRKYKIKFNYRLPTIAEWEFAAAGGLNPDSFPYGVVRPWLEDKNYSFQIKNDPEYWVTRCLDTLKIKYDKDDLIHKVEFNVKEDFYFGLNDLICCDLVKYFGVTNVESYPVNDYGLYNMIGNVAEMTLTKWIAKGGAYVHSLYDFSLKTNFIYNGPTEWLGFRCICEVKIEERK